MRTILLTLVVVFAGGCMTQKATSVPLPPERGTECAAHCRTLDMELSAVVIIMNSAGCVCTPAGKAEADPAVIGGAVAVAGGAMEGHRRRQAEAGSHVAN